MLSRWRAVFLAAVILGGFACDAKSPTAPQTTPSPTLLTAVIGACAYKLDSSVIPSPIPTSGGIYTLQLMTDPGCAWTVEVPFAPMGFVESGASKGSGSSAIGFRVYPHTGTLDRKVDLTIATMKVSRIQSAAAMPVAGPNAVLLYSGTADQSMSYGQAGIATTDQYKVTSLWFGGLPVYLSLDALGPSTPWPSRFTVIMEAANRTPLSPGVYTDLTRWLGPGGSTNTASVAIGSFLCEPSSTSRFEILDITRSGDSTLTRVHFKMLYRCAMDPPTSLLTIEGWFPSKGAF